jgi:uncharacterized protein (DUF4415 family)
MNNASIGNTTQPELLNQTDWARIQAMTDDDIVFDEDNPRTQPEDWDNAIISHSYAELREKLAERRRGLQKAPLKKQVAIRFSPEVLDYFRATGKGWQTRMDAALREWIHDHPQAV